MWVGLVAMGKVNPWICLLEWKWERIQNRLERLFPCLGEGLVAMGVSGGGYGMWDGKSMDLSAWKWE